MAPAAPHLPARFPCWCRAVYSWGGETKRDLGFVEGDLIECLNAGDGQWWMGRLRRDRRIVGLFPSNFVELLAEDFVPGGGPNTIALTQPSPRTAADSSFAPKKQKTLYRKPFQAHKEAVAPSADASGTESATTPAHLVPEMPPRGGHLAKSSKPLRTQPATAKQPLSPLIRPSSRSGTTPPASNALRRSTSPQPPRQHDMQTPSPPVPRHDLPFARPFSHEVSPLQMQEREESPPPPPPPPHRIAVNRRPSHLSSSEEPFEMKHRHLAVSRTPSPGPTSPSRSSSPSPSETNGHTPSPLRDAMEDVMTSLEDMGLAREVSSPSPSPMFTNPWSAETYGVLQDTRSATPLRSRPLTSLSFDGGGNPDVGSRRQRNTVYPSDHYFDGPPQLNNYVQRMESRLRQLQEQHEGSFDELQPATRGEGTPPPLPPKNVPYRGRINSTPAQDLGMAPGYDFRESLLNRTSTNKSNLTTTSSGAQSLSTNMTSSTDRTNQSLMSGPSAGGFSATSAASFARRVPFEFDRNKNGRPNTSLEALHSRGFGDLDKLSRPETPFTGISYHSSHNSSRQGAESAIPWSTAGTSSPGESTAVFGGLSTPKIKRQSFFKKIFDSAKTGAASARSSISVGQGGSAYSPGKGKASGGTVSPSAFSVSHPPRDGGRDPVSMGGSNTVDWVQVRRDVNRATSPSRNEMIERAERCQMMDYPVIYAVEELHETAEGDESIDGLPISEPTNFNTANLALVDKSARFVNNLSPMTSPASLAQGFVCRPYKSDVQRLRAIFTWVSEKIAWDNPVEGLEVDLKRVLQSKRGSPHEVARLVQDMCAAVGLHAEIIHGFLKKPGEVCELDSISRPNHWWNAVLVDGEWRFMDCSLASPTHPRRQDYVFATSTNAEPWYFLARPLEICYTHVPLYPEHQHICPPISPDVLLALPAACPSFFKNAVLFPDYDTSMIRIENLEVMQIRLLVPPDVECAAEVEAPSFARDVDGDFFESGDVVRKRALVQPDWVCGQKRFTIKAVLPGDEGQGTLKVYAGKKGLMHSSRDIPHPLALALPILHSGDNPPYDFVLRHPTPHAQRHDLYIMQPQCARLAVNNTFVFAVRQHPSSITSFSLSSGSGSEVGGASGRGSPPIFTRPSSALSMVSSSAGGSTISTDFSASTSAISSTKSGTGREKPAKLAIQSPSGKILRLTRKADHMVGNGNINGYGTGLSANPASDAAADGSIWETVIKIGERGVWRGLVLADRVARWCVFCEWECY